MRIEWDERKPSETNLERFDELSDEMIDTSDIPPLSDKFFERATWRLPKPLVAYLTCLIQSAPDSSQTSR